MNALEAVAAAARVLVFAPHKYDLEDGNYHVEGVPYKALKEAVVKLSMAELDNGEPKVRSTNSQLMELLEKAWGRMDNARNILTDGKPTPERNWGMLDTRLDRAVLGEQSCMKEQSRMKKFIVYLTYGELETVEADSFDVSRNGSLMFYRGIEEPSYRDPSVNTFVNRASAVYHHDKWRYCKMVEVSDG